MSHHLSSPGHQVGNKVYNSLNKMNLNNTYKHSNGKLFHLQKLHIDIVTVSALNQNAKVWSNIEEEKEVNLLTMEDEEGMPLRRSIEQYTGKRSSSRNGGGVGNEGYYERMSTGKKK
jgi:hypothetical protein